MTARTDTAYTSKLKTPAEAVALIRDNDTIAVPTGAGEPPTVLHALAERKDELHGVRLWQTLPLRPYSFIDPAYTGNITYDPVFLGGSTRPAAQAGWMSVTPAHFSDMPEMVRRGELKVDVAIALVSEMDAEGYFSCSLGVDYMRAAFDKARDIILEVNPNVPYCHGDNKVHISQVSALIESDDPVISLPSAAYTAEEVTMASYVASLIPDGATLQVGIGGVPSAVVAQLTDRNDLGIHSEMMNDGIFALIEAGVATNAKKNIKPGSFMCTFALGSPRLYEFMDHNPSLEMNPVDITNDPSLAGQYDNLHSINSTMQVDFAGQCGSETIGTLPYSGTGGQSDFVRAANRSKGGKAIIVVPSTAVNGTISRIVPTLTPGTHVTTHKNDVNYIVTEFGIAQLRGKSIADRARALIEIAHPDFRDELIEGAKAIKLF